MAPILRTCAALAAALAVAVTATPAQAADPVKMGVGRQPALAVSPDGTGHLAWITGDVPNQIGYCRLPAGTTVCDKPVFLSLPAPAGSKPTVSRLFVFAPAANELTIVAGCDCGGSARVIRWIRAPYIDQVDIAGPTGFDLYRGAGVWIDEAGAFKTFIGATETGSVRSLQLGFSGGAQMWTAFFTAAYPSLARVPGKPMLVYAGVGSALSGYTAPVYTVFTGKDLGTTELDDPKIAPKNWSPPVNLVDPSIDLRSVNLVAGSTRVSAVSRLAAGASTHVVLQPFDATTRTFGAPTNIAGDDHVDDGLWGPVATADAAGRIHALWRSPYDGGRLRYTVSDPSGAHFAPAATLAMHDQFDWATLAAGADGHGWVAWSLNDASPIWLARIDPKSESSPVITPVKTAVPTATPKPVATPKPAATPKPTATPVPKHATPPAQKWPPDPHPAEQIAGGTVRLSAPAPCLRRGARFTTSVSLRARGARIRRADFWVDGVRVKIDRRAPFRQRLSTAKLFVGAHVVMVRVTVRTRHSQVRRALWRTFRVCAS